MPFNEELATKVRESLSLVRNVEEKKMFRGITFMINEKMCISVGNYELMCRIGPEAFEAALERNGCRPMIHGKRVMRGFVFVSEEGYSRKKDFDFWIDLALDFNRKALPAKKKIKTRINHSLRVWAQLPLSAPILPFTARIPPFTNPW